MKLTTQRDVSGMSPKIVLHNYEFDAIFPLIDSLLEQLEPITQFSQQCDGSSWDESSEKPGPQRKWSIRKWYRTFYNKTRNFPGNGQVVDPAWRLTSWSNGGCVSIHSKRQVVGQALRTVAIKALTPKPQGEAAVLPERIYES